MLSPSDAVVRAFLQNSMIVQVATLSQKGRPFVTPLWFVLHADALYITTGPGTRVGKNLPKNEDGAHNDKQELGKSMREFANNDAHRGFWPPVMQR